MNIIETNLTFKSNHSEMIGGPKGYVLHHAAIESCTVEDIHRWHQNQGWAGIGYHFFVRKDGKVYRGRPENWIGAHTSGYNDRIGICAEGNFENDIMSAVQENSIVELLKYLYSKYGELEVNMHRDFNATACPGKNYPFDEIVRLSKETSAGSTVLYRVQIGAFSVKSNADALLSKLKSAGFEGFIAQSDGLYKVQSGAFADKANAQAQIKRLKALGFDAFIASAPKSLNDIAKEVIAGLWGNGQDRKDRLKAAGYDPDKVQSEVNSLL